MNDYIIAVILGVVEGLTEYLPVSSTGHMILVGDWLGFDGPRASVFEVFIQLGAILSVLLIYKEKFLRMNLVEKRTQENALLIELPEYKRPSSRTVGIYVWEKVKDYLSRAGTIIFAASIIMQKK